MAKRNAKLLGLKGVPVGFPVEFLDAADAELPRVVKAYLDALAYERQTNPTTRTH